MNKNWENNLLEYDGKWQKKGKDGNCEPFTMSDLKELINQAKQEERERIKKIVKDMPDTFPELESDDYDEAYKDAKRYILTNCF